MELHGIGNGCLDDCVSHLLRLLGVPGEVPVFSERNREKKKPHRSCLSNLSNQRARVNPRALTPKMCYRLHQRWKYIALILHSCYWKSSNYWSKRIKTNNDCIYLSFAFWERFQVVNQTLMASLLVFWKPLHQLLGIDFVIRVWVIAVRTGESLYFFQGFFGYSARPYQNEWWPCAWKSCFFFGGGGG